MRKIKLWKNRDEMSDHEAIIDDEDYERVVEAIKYKNGKPGKWYAHDPSKGKLGYVYAWDGDHRKSMHRVIMDPPKGMDIDHINGDTLDNRKENLRICTRSQNAQNKKLRRDSASGYKGVHEQKKPSKRKYVSKKTGKVTYHYYMPKKRFKAYIGEPDWREKGLKNSHINLGRYDTAEEAARVRDKKAKELHGEFAYLNFPEEV
tara:strand:- start:954 stop:1565 length:612 start_codon:yes stop_codon:yes gene_type:complete